MLLEKSGEVTPERMKRCSQSEKSPAVDVTGDGSKVRCCKEHYCRGLWNVSSIKSEEVESKRKQHPVVVVTGDGSQVRCCKEQYCIGTWNVRSMNQGKLEVVKQEMARI